MISGSGRSTTFDYSSGRIHLWADARPVPARPSRTSRGCTGPAPPARHGLTATSAGLSPSEAHTDPACDPPVLTRPVLTV